MKRRPNWFRRLLRRSSETPAFHGTPVFLDTNILLEGKPLEDLPWGELAVPDPILVLLTPQVLKELDSKKRDGRLGPLARSINRRISDAVGGRHVSIRPAHPKVSLSLAVCERIDWDRLKELDPHDGDSRVVAEALYAQNVPNDSKLLVSHDLNPINIASRIGLRAFHVSDSWLRQPEPSPADKEIQRLKQRIAILEHDEPTFEITFGDSATDPVQLFRVAPLDSAETTTLQSRILALHPRKQQRFGPFMSPLEDSSYDERYSDYETKTVPAFVAAYHKHLELLYGQVAFEVGIANVGAIQGEDVLIEIESDTGWVHDRYAFISPSGPRAPKVRDMFGPLLQSSLPNIVRGARQVDRHEFVVESDRSRPPIEVRCQDFRHGHVWTFNGIAWIDPSTSDPMEITVRVTATNSRGEKRASLPIRKHIENVHWSALVDPESLRPIRPLPMLEELEEAVRTKDFSGVDWLDQDTDE